LGVDPPAIQTLEPGAGFHQACLMFDVCYVLCMLHICSMFAGRLLDVYSMFARSCEQGIKNYEGRKRCQYTCMMLRNTAQNLIKNKYTWNSE